MMKWFYNMKIGKKLTIAFVCIAMLTGVVGFVGIVQMNSIDRKYTEFYEGYGVSMGYLLKVSEGYQMRRGLLKDLIIQTDPEAEKVTVEAIKKVDQVINDNIELYQNTITSKEDQEIYDELVELFSKYNPLKDGFITHAMANEDDLALGLMSGAGSETAKQVEQTIDKIVQYNVTTGRNISNENTESTKSALILMIGIILFGICLAIIMGAFISRIISKPIRKLVEDANKIADGDLNVTSDIQTKDEVGLLAKAFARMTDNLNDIVTNISEASAQVASGSKQVSGSSQILSSGATEQASSIEELTASMEEISEQTNLNAKNANQANLIVVQAKENAIQGNEQMKDMLKAMDEINNASGNISKIIKVIDDIAFQTNILALNAAVEAARAGQYGKGFAVVAEEVRNLAARSANAAKETTDMIEGSIKKVEGGTKTANHTADALKMIVEGVTKVADLVGSIANASDEQAKGIIQINQGIMQVSAVVQTNSATSEESAAASEELAGQAELLSSQVARFKLKKSIKNTQPSDEAISQEVMKMLNINQTDLHSNTKSEPTIERPTKIILNDNEFGKY